MYIYIYYTYTYKQKSLYIQATSLLQVLHFEAKHWHAKGYGGNNRTPALRRLMLANKHITACAKEAPLELATSRRIPMFVISKFLAGFFSVR